MTNNGVHEGEWQTVGSKNSENEGGVHTGTITGENVCSPMQVAAATRENGDNRSRSYATSIDNTSKDDGMQSYHVKTGYIEVRFMTGNIKGFNGSRALKQFLVVAREQDDEFKILPLAGIGNNLCIGTDVQKSKAGIEQYLFNIINGKLRIRTSQGLEQLKSGSSKFQFYLEQQRVYLNKAQLGEEDGITLGWILKSHPAFCYRDDMK
jgi:hypothetical protein